MSACPNPFATRCVSRCVLVPFACTGSPNRVINQQWTRGSIYTPVFTSTCLTFDGITARKSILTPSTMDCIEVDCGIRTPFPSSLFVPDCLASCHTCPEASATALLRARAGSTAKETRGGQQQKGHVVGEEDEGGGGDVVRWWLTTLEQKDRQRLLEG